MSSWLQKLLNWDSLSKRTSDYRASRKSKIAFNADKNTYELYVAGKSKRFPSGIVRRAIRKLEYINLAYTIEGMFIRREDLQ